MIVSEHCPVEKMAVFPPLHLFLHALSLYAKNKNSRGVHSALVALASWEERKTEM